MTELKKVEEELAERRYGRNETCFKYISQIELKCEIFVV